MTISTITAMPDSPVQPADGTEAEKIRFVLEEDAFIAAIETLISEFNTAAAEANAATVAIDEYVLQTGAVSSYTGPYNAGTSYSTGDSISYEGAFYISLVDSNLGNTPTSGASDANWYYISISIGVAAEPTDTQTIADASGTVQLDLQAYRKFIVEAIDDVTLQFVNKPTAVRTRNNIEVKNGNLFTISLPAELKSESLPLAAPLLSNYFENTAGSIPLGSGSQIYGLRFLDNGNRMITLTSNDDLFIYSLNTPYDPKSNAGGALSSYNTSGDGAATPFDFWVKDDGTLLWLLDNTDDFVYIYSFGTPFDLTTLTLDGTFDFSSQLTSSQYGITASADGTFMHISRFNSSVYQYQLSVPFDLTSAVYQGAYNPGISASGRGKVVFDDSGYICCRVATATANSVSFSILTNPFDLSALTLASEATLDISVASTYFSATGLDWGESSFIAVGNNEDYIDIAKLAGFMLDVVQTGSNEFTTLYEANA